MISELKNKIIDDVLSQVEKPARYAGGETNIVIKPQSEDIVKMGLCFPDSYELGMSYMGFSILYNVINNQKNYAAERVFAPYKDMEEQLKKNSLPLYTLESFTPLYELDVLGFTLQYELSYTNILTMLDLGKVPIYSKDRDETHPIVIAGGPCASNPEPIADFFDIIVIGDGEEVVLKILEIINSNKTLSRKEKIKEISKLEGIYIPSYYKPIYSSDNNFVKLEKNITDAKDEIKATKIKTLNPENYPKKPIVPLIEIVHNRLGVEIMRGCTRGCRFCAAGYFYRPARERDVADIISQAKSGIANSGWQELSFLSLSSTDYTSIQPLLKQTNNVLKDVNISLPSTRSDTVTFEILENISTIRKSGITIAPEAGSERLRILINKNLSEEEITTSVITAFKKQWKLIKLYFMIGLPTETEEDIDAIINLVTKLYKQAKNVTNRPSFNISISPHSPKPHTPFQWVSWGDEEILLKRAKKIKFALTKLRGIKVSYPDTKMSLLESIFARGDRKLSKVIYKAWESNARFDGWSDIFNFEIWEEAFKSNGIDPLSYTRNIKLEINLPWNHIEIADIKFLKHEYQKALKLESTGNCRKGEIDLCCNICNSNIKNVLVKNDANSTNNSNSTPNKFGRRSKIINKPNSGNLPDQSFRIKYTKSGPARFLGNRDIMQIMERAIKSSGIPVSYSQGYNPHPKLSFGPPCALGHNSNAEYFDIKINQHFSGKLEDRLNLFLPLGLRVISSTQLFVKVKSLTADIIAIDYEAIIKGIDYNKLEEKVNDFISKNTVEIVRIKKSVEKIINIRPFIMDMKAINNSNVSSPTLQMKLSTGDKGHGKPSDVLKALLGLSDEEIKTIKVTRTEQWVERNGKLVAPIV